MLPVYTPPTRSIPLPKDAGNLVVRGLSFEDISGLVVENTEEITQAVTQYRESIGSFYSTRASEALLETLLTGFPNLLAQVIAYAADQRDGADQVRKYPAGVQIAAVTAVIELTLEDMGDLSDPSPALVLLVKRATGALKILGPKSLSSFGDSDASSATSEPQGA